MNRYQFITLVIAVLLGVAIHAAIFRYNNSNRAMVENNRIKLLEDQNKTLQHDILYLAAYADSIETVIHEKDGVIVKLNNDILSSREKLRTEKSRINKLTRHELTKEILDYYGN